MTNIEPPTRPKQRSKVLITGTALICGACVLGMAGLGLTTGALVAAARRRMNRMELPPRELAKRTLVQARAATAAGRNAWRDVTVGPAAQTEGNPRIASRPPGRPVREHVGV